MYVVILIYYPQMPRNAASFALIYSYFFFSGHLKMPSFVSVNATLLLMHTTHCNLYCSLYICFIFIVTQNSAICNLFLLQRILGLF